MDAGLLQRIDVVRLTQNLGGDRRKVNEALSLFLKTAKETVDKLANAEKERNIILWQQLNQQLKTSAQRITAKRLLTLCFEADAVKEFAHPQSLQIVYNMHKEIALLDGVITKHLSSRAEPLL